MQWQNKKKIALVLGGGGIKAAAFHIGVCLALREKGFRFAGGPTELVRHKYPDDMPLTVKMYVGSSAGAFIASILAAGYDTESLINAFQLGSGTDPTFRDRTLRYLRPLAYRDIFSVNGKNLLRFIPEAILKKTLVTGGFESLLKNSFKLNGLFTTRGLERYLREDVLVDNEFAKLGVELYITATQLNHTRQALFGPFKESNKTSTHKYINYASISEAVACSTSLPPVFAPTAVTNQNGKDIMYYDGEIRSTLSVPLASEFGADLVIASYSTQPYHYNDEMGSLDTYGIPVIINQALYQVIQQKIVRNIEWQSQLKQIYKSIDQYCKESKISETHREQILEMIRQRLNFRPEVDYLYIHPRPQNYEMFFVDHFSLNPKILDRIVRIGFKSTLSALKSRDF
ncbi:MAG: patatin-like phospholipase family protein [Pseudobdellovibrionaceae bacterium]